MTSPARTYRIPACCLAVLGPLLLWSCSVGPGTGGSLWTTTAVTSTWSVVGVPDFGSTGIDSPAIALNPVDTPYVAYRDWSLSRLSVHMFDGTAWVNVGTPSSASGGNGVGYTGLVIGPDGNPIVSYKIQGSGLAEVRRTAGAPRCRCCAEL